MAVGVGLRVALALAYTPAVLDNPDSGRYLAAAFGPAGLFSDPFAPGGYPLLLRLGRALSAELWVTVALQHALGVGAAALLYAGVRRVGAPVAVAALPAAAVLLSADELYLEHALLSESLFLVLVAGGLYAAVRAAASPRSALAWGGAAGILLGAGGLTRGVGLALVALVAAWTVTVPARARRRRLALSGVVLVGAILVVGPYVATAGGGPTGLVEQRGWSLYARAAPFARCAAFRPPEGTAALCEPSATPSRAGGSLYLWDRRRSPARRVFGFPPGGNDRVGAFARAAIAAQPLDYAREVANDLARVPSPDRGSRRVLSGGGAGTLALDRRAHGFEGEVGRAAAAAFTPAPVRVAPEVVEALTAYQRVTAPVLRWGLVLGLAAAGLALLGAGAPSERRGMALFGGAALVLLVVPTALFQYTPRFGVPAIGPGVAGGALGAWALGRARRDHAGRVRARSATPPVWKTPAP